MRTTFMITAKTPTTKARRRGKTAGATPAPGPRKLTPKEAHAVLVEAGRLRADDPLPADDVTDKKVLGALRGVAAAIAAIYPPDDHPAASTITVVIGAGIDRPGVIGRVAFVPIDAPPDLGDALKSLASAVRKVYPGERASVVFHLAEGGYRAAQIPVPTGHY